MNLALPSSKLPLVYRHSLQHYVSCLPYVDEELDPRTKAAVNLLVQQEMKQMELVDYLHELPMPVTKTTELIRAEMTRVEAGQEMTKQDFYNKPQEISEFQDTHEIQTAISDLNCYDQYNQISYLNQELLHRYGKEAWTQLLNSQEKEKTRLLRELEKARESITGVNAQRKYEQIEVRYKLDGYKSKVQELIENNLTLEVECDQLEESMNVIKRKKMRLY